VPLRSLAGCSNVATSSPSRLPRLNFMRSHYETLGIPKEASAERIKRSYRKLVKLYHPDQFPGRSREQAETEKRMRDINVAYSVLSKPLSRMHYDAKLNGRAFSRIQVDPEHCCRCGKMTGHWESTLRKVALCSACV
jgi:DnaJ-class molecular chaperone